MSNMFLYHFKKNFGHTRWDLVLRPGIGPAALASEGGLLTTGLQGSPYVILSGCLFTKEISDWKHFCHISYFTCDDNLVLSFRILFVVNEGTWFVEETGFGKSHLVWQKLNRWGTPGSHCEGNSGTQNMGGTFERS